MGGVIMKAKARGHRVVLITATRGEVGEIYNMDEAEGRPRLGEIRTQELKAAAEILGVDRQEFLGYRDSGMVDTADNRNPRSFHQAPLDEAAEQEGSPVRKLYYTAIPRSMIEAFVEQMPEEARRAMGGNMRVAGTPDELVTTKVDVHDYVERKRDAFRAHVSQNDPNSWFSTMQDQVYELAFGTEYYQLARGKPGSALPEPDLFSGIDQGLPRRLEAVRWKS